MRLYEWLLELLQMKPLTFNTVKSRGLVCIRLSCYSNESYVVFFSAILGLGRCVVQFYFYLSYVEFAVGFCGVQSYLGPLLEFCGVQDCLGLPGKFYSLGGYPGQWHDAVRCWGFSAQVCSSLVLPCSFNDNCGYELLLCRLKPHFITSV